ncbi:MAG: SpoIIE family protein phosphatase, partial [Phycisphaeraceae bacterium]
PEALGLIERIPPDVIVMDAAACNGEGLAWTQRLKADPATCDIPVIMLAPTGDELDALAEPESAVDECLAKPIRDRELLLRVRSAARLRQHRGELRDNRGLRGEQARMWGALVDFCRSVAKAVDLDAVLEQIVTTAAEMTCSRRVSLMLPDESEQFLTIAKAIGFDDETTAGVRVPIGDAVAGQAYASGRPITSADNDGPPTCRPAYHGKSFVSMPIVSTMLNTTHQRVGVLNITHRYGDQPFQDWELEFINLLGNVAGSAIDDILWRRARESLLKLERDLQLARQIQQSTFPSRLPVLRGFQIDAWTEPAEETGGDTYDVIGYQQDADGRPILVSADQADRAVLLLADATGHGIGPALSVTQVRAMLRMAVRMQPELTKIARHMNEQLYADLPQGRFITAWLGELDATDNTLTSLSAGQAPIIRYDAARDTLDVLAANAMPFGIVADLDITITDHIPMNAGDIFAVISDGVFEATDHAGRQFGTDRVIDLIPRHRHESPTQILAALREAVAKFTNGAPAADDRTAIIVKRMQR